MHVSENGFGSPNTLLIECEAIKARDFKENTILLDVYTEEEILTGGLDGKSHALRDIDPIVRHKEEYLLRVRDYIVKLANEAVDIPEYLKKYPFSNDLKEEQVRRALLNSGNTPQDDGDIGDNADNGDKRDEV